MNNKIKNYVDVLFSDIPRSKKANELKEEILTNMSERFEDYIKEGKTENQAYCQVVSSLGDIDEMLADVMPSDEFVKQANHFRRHKAKGTAIAVGLYIIGAAFLMGFGGLGVYLGNEDLYGIIGLIILLVISAFATGLIVYTNMSIPLEFKDYHNVAKKEFNNLDIKHSKLLDNITTIYWTIITFIYLVISFMTGLWFITWIIWLPASVVPYILKTIFEMRYSNE